MRRQIDGFSKLCNTRRDTGRGLAHSAKMGPPSTLNALRRPRWSNLPCLLCLLPFLALQIHGHHAPGQVFHALLVGELSFGFAVEFPYLDGQRVFLLHLIWIVEVGVGGVISPIREDGLTEQVFVGLRILGRGIQLVSDLVVVRGTSGLTM